MLRVQHFLSHVEGSTFFFSRAGHTPRKKAERKDFRKQMKEWIKPVRLAEANKHRRGRKFEQLNPPKVKSLGAPPVHVGEPSEEVANTCV